MNDITISIDGRQHIRKLCDRYLTEKEKVLLEWVRFARLRHADQITLTISQSQTLIIDNGEPIAANMWQAFESLLHADLAEDIERSIENLKPQRGIGILAPLATSSETFFLANPTSEGMRTISHGPAIAEKTRNRVERHVTLILGHRSIDLNREQEILKYHLPMVQAQIMLNHEPIKPRLHNQDTFLSLKLYQGDASVGSVSLPKSNNHSSLELCHGDIPWRTVHFPAHRGRVYHARLNTISGEDELGDFLQQIDKANDHLLEYLRDHPEKWPPALRKRIEELLFEWSRYLVPDIPIKDLPLFTLSGSSKRLSLADILKNVEKIPVNAIITERDQTPPGKGILLLSRKQADFLGRTVGISLNFIGQPSQIRYSFFEAVKKRLRYFGAALDRLFSLFSAQKSKSLTITETTRILSDLFMNAPEWSLIPDLAHYKIQPVHRRGLWPSHLHHHKKLITLNLKHPITRYLLQAHSEKKPLSLMVKAMMPPEAS